MTVLIDATPSYVSFVDGDFDTRYRYLRKISGANSMGITRGVTWDLYTIVSGISGSSDGWNLNFSCASRKMGSTYPSLSNSTVAIDVGNNTSGTPGTALDISPTAGISISDPSTGRLLFDPSQPLMHVINEVTGSKTISSANPSGSAVSIRTSHNLGAIDPAATDILGAIQMVYDDTTSVSFAPVGKVGNDWWQVNGSYIVHWAFGTVGTGAAKNQVTDGTVQGSLCGISIMTFRVSTSADSVGVGRIIMDEKTDLRRLFAGGQWNPEGGGSVASFIRPAYTLNYRLKAVAFSS